MSLFVRYLCITRDGSVHSDTQDADRCDISRLRLPEGGAVRVRGELRRLAPLLGRPRRLLRAGAGGRPATQPAPGLLPRLPDHQVRLPGLVYGPGTLEWQ